MPKYIPNEENQSAVLDSLVISYQNGKKSSLVNPRFASLSCPQNDGLEPSPLPEESFLKDCAKIGAFLMDIPAFTAQLKKLNALLESVVSPEKNVKEFRTLLQTELSKEGFFPGFGKTFGNIQPDVFRAMIAHGILLKDAVLGGFNHGEFTHIIQWLMIAWQQRDTGFLDSSVVSLFKQFGHEKAVITRKSIYDYENPKARRNEYSLWDVIVDRLDDVEDFRQPTNLHWMLLQTEDPELSLLKEMIGKRVDKRIKPGAADKYKSQFNTPHNFYHISSMPLIHEPENSNIDWDLFRKNGY